VDNLHEDDPTRVDLQRYIEDALALLQNYMVSKVRHYCQGTGSKQHWPRGRLKKVTVKIIGNHDEEALAAEFFCVCDIV
jgi:hypothetical protein